MRLVKASWRRSSVGEIRLRQLLTVAFYGALKRSRRRCNVAPGSSAHADVFMKAAVPTGSSTREAAKGELSMRQAPPLRLDR